MRALARLCGRQRRPRRVPAACVLDLVPTFAVWRRLRYASPHLQLLLQASHLVKVHKDKLTVTYNGKANHANDVGAVQANRPFAHDVLVGYFEMTIINQGERASMSIGLANSSFKNTRHPGWEPGSYGYHGEDGRKFNNSSRGEPYAVKYGAVDDVIGCGLNFSSREIFYTKNGKHLGTAFSEPAHSYYPTVGLHSAGEEVRLNFGTDPRSPFVFDLEGLLREQRDKMLATVAVVPVSLTDVNQLVRCYLHHEGYADALDSFEKSAALDSSLALPAREAADRSHRSAIRQLIMDGKVQAARQKCQECYPSLLEMKPLARAELLCQEFVELLAQGNKTESILFARSVLGPLLKASLAVARPRSGRDLTEGGEEGNGAAAAAANGKCGGDGSNRAGHHEGAGGLPCCFHLAPMPHARVARTQGAEKSQSALGKEP
jgi:hypothetical protein